MVTTIFLISAVGFGISVYAYFVEQALVNNQKYKAVCDLSDVISCTKPLLSPYSGHGLLCDHDDCGSG
jgi:hypothetical protein